MSNLNIQIFIYSFFYFPGFREKKIERERRERKKEIRKEDTNVITYTLII